MLSEPPLPLFEAPSAAGRPPSYIADHRMRLRARFVEGGADAMPDYELLELLLFRAIPRRDVKPIAHALLGRFGDLGAVLGAEIAALTEIDGVGPHAAAELAIVAAAARRMAQSRLRQRPILSSWHALLDYCRTAMAHRSTEALRILYLDTRNGLIADEAQTGTVDHVPLAPRQVVKRALELDAKALIVVHNHPSGDPTPSSSDVAMTKQLVAACATLDITVHDHLVIGRGREVSFAADGLL